LARNIGSLSNPLRQPWKQLFLSALQAATPAKLGPVMAFLSSAMSHLAFLRDNNQILSLRQRSYLQALHKLQPFRLVKPDDMEPGSILLEPTVFNPRIRDNAGRPLNA
jgi:hypothetical protein